MNTISMLQSPSHWAVATSYLSIVQASQGFFRSAVFTYPLS